jgi:hypothetical protein
MLAIVPGGQAMPLHAAHDRLGKACDAFRIITERARIGDRIIRIDVHVHHWCTFPGGRERSVERVRGVHARLR